MSDISLVGSKALLAFCNFLLLACGCILVTGGLMILLDPERILLSRLLAPGPLTTMSHPLLYYLALGITILGLVLAGAGILGCWASCIHSYFMLTIYFLVVLIVLIGECAVYAMAWAYPHCLGLGMDGEQLAKSLRENYGVAGQEQLTAAIDLAQFTFNCCGISTAIEYDTSLWRLQSLGPSLAVPLTCCKLANLNQRKAYLNPVPINASLCQALELDRQQGLRHVEGCADRLELWYKEQYIVFLVAGLIMVLIEFMVLLSTILACTKLYRFKRHAKDVEDAKVASSTIPKIPKASENLYQQRRSPFADSAYTMSNSFRQNYKLIDRA